MLVDIKVIHNSLSVDIHSDLKSCLDCIIYLTYNYKSTIMFR